MLGQVWPHIGMDCTIWRLGLLSMPPLILNVVGVGTSVSYGFQQSELMIESGLIHFLIVVTTHLWSSSWQQTWNFLTCRTSHGREKPSRLQLSVPCGTSSSQTYSRWSRTQCQVLRLAHWLPSYKPHRFPGKLHKICMLNLITNQLMEMLTPVCK